MLSVSTKQGSLHSYLMKVPCLCAGWDTKVAFLASLRELCVTDRSVHPQTTFLRTQFRPENRPTAAFYGLNSALLQLPPQRAFRAIHSHLEAFPRPILRPNLSLSH